MVSRIQLIKFTVQIVFSTFVLGLCSVQLYGGSKNEALYWGGITSIIGYWLPSPTEVKKDE